MRRGTGWRSAGGLALAVTLAAGTAAGPAAGTAGAQTGDGAQAAVSAALRAVEADGGDAHAATLRARLAADPRDRATMLGLATVARLRYAYPLADSLLDALLADPGAPAAVRAWALLGGGQAQGARGFVRAADSLFGLATDAARAANAPAPLAEALLGRAGTRGRSTGLPAALASLDSADAAIAAAAAQLSPPELARLHAATTCGRASLRTRAGAPGVMALIDSGMALAAHAPARVLGGCYFSRAQEYARHGDMLSAAEALDSATALLRRAGDRATLAGALQWRGYAAVAVGSFELAQRDLAAALAEATASEALLPMAWALINVGQIASATGALVDATAYLGRAESILARIGDETGVATARAFLAALALQSGDLRGARARYEANRRWAERTGDWQQLSESLRGLFQVATRERDEPSARALLDSAAAMSTRLGGARWAPINAWDRGVLALRFGDGARAERELRAALPAYVPSQGGSRFRLRVDIAHALLLQGDTAGAAAELRDASDGLDTWRGSLGTDRLRAAVFQLRDPVRDPPSVETVIAGVAASGRVAEAFDLAERRRARMLRDALLHPAPARDTAPGAAQGAAVGATARGAATVDALAAALPDARSALALVVAGTDGAPGTLFVVTRAGAAAHRLPPDDSLARLADRLRARVEDGVDAAAPARALGEALFGRRGARLPRGLARLVVVPDGALHGASLALLDPDGRGPLGERVALSVAPSATVAALLWARPRGAAPAARVLAFGDPAFPGAADSTGTPAAALPREARLLPRLPRSADEARDAARLSPGSRVLLGAEASEAALRSPAVRDYAVLHLATHAYVDDARPWASLIALAPGEGHDGYVRASELAALPLAAELVVLSACETAGGPVVGGEGVQGFAAALLAAGVRAVVATRWALGDGEAERMMAAFYRALGDGLPADDALRRARAELRRAGAPARTWAAFTLVGDGGVRVAPARRGSWLARLVGRR